MKVLSQRATRSAVEVLREYQMQPRVITFLMAATSFLRSIVQQLHSQREVAARKVHLIKATLHKGAEVTSGCTLVGCWQPRIKMKASQTQGSRLALFGLFGLYDGHKQRNSLTSLLLGHTDCSS